ncbi:MAG: hypothetical protein ABJZ55_16165 [Fuerstiella sp.]
MDGAKDGTMKGDVAMGKIKVHEQRRQRLSNPLPPQGHIPEAEEAVAAPPPLFHDWSEDCWARVAGKTLVIAVNLLDDSERYVCQLDSEADFDQDRFDEEHEDCAPSFFPVPELSSNALPDCLSDVPMTDLVVSSAPETYVTLNESFVKVDHVFVDDGIRTRIELDQWLAARQILMEDCLPLVEQQILLAAETGRRRFRSVPIHIGTSRRRVNPKFPNARRLHQRSRGAFANLRRGQLAEKLKMVRRLMGVK